MNWQMVTQQKEDQMKGREMTLKIHLQQHSLSINAATRQARARTLTSTPDQQGASAQVKSGKRVTEQQQQQQKENNNNKTNNKTTATTTTTKITAAATTTATKTTVTTTIATTTTKPTTKQAALKA
jgi:chromatin remodeling complex protein RSC6